MVDKIITSSIKIVLIHSMKISTLISEWMIQCSTVFIESFPKKMLKFLIQVWTPEPKMKATAPLPYLFLHWTSWIYNNKDILIEGCILYDNCACHMSWKLWKWDKGSLQQYHSWTTQPLKCFCGKVLREPPPPLYLFPELLA